MNAVYLAEKRACESLSHLRNCSEYLSAGNTPAPHRRDVAPVPSTDAASVAVDSSATTPPVHPTLGVPLSADTAATVQVLREQMEQQQRNHEEQMEVQRSIAKSLQDRGDSWKHVSKRAFADCVPSSPSSNDDEELRYMKMDSIGKERVLIGKLAAMEAVAETIGYRKRGHNERVTAYGKEVVRRTHSVVDSCKRHKERADIEKTRADREAAAVENLHNEVENMRSAGPSSSKDDHSVKKLKQKLLRMCHPDKATVAFSDVSSMAEAVSKILTQ